MAKFFPAGKAKHYSSRPLSSFARSRLCRRTAGVLALLSLLIGLSTTGLAASYSMRKQQARDQFDKAEEMRQELNDTAAADRTHKDYQHVVDAYRRVFFVAPSSSKADISIMTAAQIHTEMGRLFPPGEKDFRAAISEYEFLRREYPGSKYRMEALFAIAQLNQNDLKDNEAARQAYDEFLHRYPRNPLVPQAEQALAELNQPGAADQPPVQSSASTQLAPKPEKQPSAKADAPAQEVPATANHTPFQKIPSPVTP